MALDLLAIETQVASDLGLADPSDAAAAVSASTQYIENDTGSDPDGWEDSDALLVKGVTLLAERIYQDSPTPSGDISSFSDTAFGTSFTPKKLYSHLDEYWRHLAEQWGFA